MAVETTQEKVLSPQPLLPVSPQGLTHLKYQLMNPKFTSDELIYKSNHFATKQNVGDSEKWCYYPVKISKEKKGNFYKFEVSPPILQEGFVFLEDNKIHVPLNDLVRGNINVTRITGKESSNSIIKPASREASAEQSRVSNVLENEERKNADLAFKDQIDALLYTENSEEGGFWEVQDNS